MRLALLAVLGFTAQATLMSPPVGGRDAILAVILDGRRVVVEIGDGQHAAIGGVRQGRQPHEGVLDQRAVAVAVGRERR